MKQTRKEIEDKVLVIVQEAYCMVDSDSSLPLETKLHDLGFDSLDIVELVMAVESDFEIKVPDEDAEHWKMICDVVAYVDTKLNP